MSKTDRDCIVEVGGVGFKVLVSATTAAELPISGNIVNLVTALHIREREGTLELYGFLKQSERALFELLLEVPGVGPRGALAILSQASVEELERAIAAGDERLLTRISGIGRKKAQKILLELKERYEGLAIVSGEEAQDMADLLDALRSLGYAERDVREAVRKVPRELATTEERLRQAIKILGKSDR